MSYIEFVEGPPKPKTKTWYVCPVDSSACVGHIGWHGPWRCYSFFPRENTIFERRCLRDIADFCETRTTEHRALGKNDRWPAKAEKR